jgi:hypothetical protein
MFHQRTAHRPSFPLFRGKVEERRTEAPSMHDEEGPGLLASPAFWCGGLLSLAAWVGLALALGLL